MYSETLVHCFSFVLSVHILKNQTRGLRDRSPQIGPGTVGFFKEGSNPQTLPNNSSSVCASNLVLTVSNNANEYNWCSLVCFIDVMVCETSMLKCCISVVIAMHCSGR